MSVASEYDHAEQVVADVALLQDIAAGRLDGERVRAAAEVLLEHRRHELPSVSVAVAARRGCPPGRLFLRRHEAILAPWSDRLCPAET